MSINKSILVTAIGSFSSESVVSSLLELESHHIIGCDIYPAEWHAVSNKYSNVFQVPLVSDSEKYLRTLLEICSTNQVEYIIPLTDVEIDFFNIYRDCFAEEGVILCM